MIKTAFIINFMLISQIAYSQQLTESLTLKILNEFVCDNIEEFEPYILHEKKELYLAIECIREMGLRGTFYEVDCNCMDIKLKIWPATDVFYQDISKTIIFNKCEVHKNKAFFTLQFHPSMGEHKVYKVKIESQ